MSAGPIPYVWRTRVWFRKFTEDWAYRLYLGGGGKLQGGGYESEADARRAAARHYHQYFGSWSEHLNRRADFAWPASGREHRED